MQCIHTHTTKFVQKNLCPSCLTTWPGFEPRSLLLPFVRSYRPLDSIAHRHPLRLHSTRTWQSSGRRRQFATRLQTPLAIQSPLHFPLHPNQFLRSSTTTQRNIHTQRRKADAQACIIHTCTYVCARVHEYNVRAIMHVHTCMHVRTCKCTNVCIHLYIHIYILYV